MLATLKPNHGKHCYRSFVPCAQVGFKFPELPPFTSQAHATMLSLEEFIKLFKILKTFKDQGRQHASNMEFTTDSKTPCSLGYKDLLSVCTLNAT